MWNWKEVISSDVVEKYLEVDVWLKLAKEEYGGALSGVDLDQMLSLLFRTYSHAGAVSSPCT